MKLKEMTISNVQPRVPGHLDDAVVAADVKELMKNNNNDVEKAVVEFIEFYESCIDYEVPVSELLVYAAKGFHISVDEVKRIWHEEYPEDHSLDVEIPKMDNLGNSILESMNEAMGDLSDEELVTLPKKEMKNPCKKCKGTGKYKFHTQNALVRCPVCDGSGKNKLGESKMDLGNGTKSMGWNLDINGEDDVPVTITWRMQPAEPEVGVMQSYIDEYFVTRSDNDEDVTDLFTKDEIEDIILTFGYDSVEPGDDRDYDYDRDLVEGSIKDAEEELSNHATNKIEQENKSGPMCAHELVSHEKRRDDLLSKKRKAQRDYTKKVDKLGESSMKSIFENGKLVTTFAQYIGETELVKKYAIKESDDSIGCCNDGGARDCYSVEERNAIYNAYKSIEDRFNWDGEDFVTLPGIDCDILPQHMMEIVDEFEGSNFNESTNNEIASLVESVAKIMRR
jgi:hypothetical protein